MKRTAAVLTGLAAALALAAPAAPAHDPVAHAAKLKRCGKVSFSGTTVRIFVIRRTTCRTAEKVARDYGKFESTGKWACFLSHGGPTYQGVAYGFSCGKGGSRGDVKRWPHAFIGG
jgi:uncharacterized membrane protein